MALYLDEDMVGTDATFIAFPHLVVCMGLVVRLADHTLVGAHFTVPSTEQAILRAMRREVRASNSTMAQLYCASDLAKHIGQFGGLDINGKAEGLGFTGQGFIFDFGYMQPTDGAYVQFTSNGGADRLSVRCRLNQHMTYTRGTGTPISRGMAGTTSGQPGRAVPGTTVVTGASVEFGKDLNTPFLKPVTIT